MLVGTATDTVQFRGIVGLNRADGLNEGMRSSSPSNLRF